MRHPWHFYFILGFLLGGVAGAMAECSLLLLQSP